METAVCIVAYNEENYIKKAIKQFSGLVDKVLVMLSQVPWGGVPEEPDRTYDIAESLGAEVITGFWKTEADQRNEGQQRLKDYDWILIVDVDEFYAKEDIKKLLKFLETAKAQAYGITNLEVYWKTPQCVIRPQSRGGLIIAVKSGIRFLDKRNVGSGWEWLPKDITLHHWSYVRTDEEMLKKITTFEHRDEIVLNWYQEKWLGWTSEMENLHPVNPVEFKKAVCLSE